MHQVPKLRQPRGPAPRRHTISSAQNGLPRRLGQHHLHRFVIPKRIIRGVKIDHPRIVPHRLHHPRHPLTTRHHPGIIAHRQQLRIHLRHHLGTAEIFRDRRRVTIDRSKCDMQQPIASDQSKPQSLQPFRSHQLIRPGTIQLRALHIFHVHGVILENALRSIRHHKHRLRESTRLRVIDLRRRPLLQLAGTRAILRRQIFPKQRLLILNAAPLRRLQTPHPGPILVHHQLHNPLRRPLRLRRTIPAQIDLLDHPHRKPLPQPGPLRIGQPPDLGLIAIPQRILFRLAK